MLARALDTTPEDLGQPSEPGLYVKLSDVTPELFDLDNHAKRGCVLSG